MKATILSAIAFACGFGVCYVIFGRIVDRDGGIVESPSIAKNDIGVFDNNSSDAASRGKTTNKPGPVAAKTFPNLPKGYQAVVLHQELNEYIAGSSPSPGDHFNIFVIHDRPEGGEPYTKVLIERVTLLEFERSVEVSEDGRAAPKTVTTVAVRTEDVPYIELAKKRGRIAIGMCGVTDESLQPSSKK